jgi:hypothetical protein
LQIVFFPFARLQAEVPALRQCSESKAHSIKNTVILSKAFFSGVGGPASISTSVILSKAKDLRLLFVAETPAAGQAAFGIEDAIS